MGIFLVILFFLVDFVFGQAQNHEVCCTHCRISCDDEKYSAIQNFADKCRVIQNDCRCNRSGGDPIVIIIWVSAFVGFTLISMVGGYLRHKFWRRNSTSQRACFGLDCSRANWTHSSSTAPVMHLPITAHPVTTVSSQFNAQYSNFS